MPYSMTCAVIMKMMSNTSTTSTNGVTLISESAETPRPRRPLFIPPTLIATGVTVLGLFSEAPLDQIQKLQ